MSTIGSTKQNALLSFGPTHRRVDSFFHYSLKAFIEHGYTNMERYVLKTIYLSKIFISFLIHQTSSVLRASKWAIS